MEYPTNNWRECLLSFSKQSFCLTYRVHGFPSITVLHAPCFSSCNPTLFPLVPFHPSLHSLIFSKSNPSSDPAFILSKVKFFPSQTQFPLETPNTPLQLRHCLAVQSKCWSHLSSLYITSPTSALFIAQPASAAYLINCFYALRVCLSLTCSFWPNLLPWLAPPLSKKTYCAPAVLQKIN